MKIINQFEALEKLKIGKPIIFQTDTLPAIGCMPEHSEIIYKVKKRDKNKALILMGSKIQQVLDYVDNEAMDDFQEIAGKFWPGPLTLIIPIRKNKSLNFITSENTLGIRIPDSLTARSLLLETGPLATSSANISGLNTSFDAESVSTDLPTVDLLGPIPWHKCSGLGSTIISWVKDGKWRLVREGQIPIQKLNKCIL
tara:strand:+ start:50 stop:643 length:594 start_codon:yes stop_codon:yes gene_type:complete